MNLFDDRESEKAQARLEGGMICVGCGKGPSEIAEYAAIAKAEGMTPEEYVLYEEGTYNPKNGHFACTDCYVKMGMPSSPRGWVAP